MGDYREYSVTLTGTTPLLMHNDDLNWRSEMDRWLSVPDNKKQSKAGDDRCPAYRWLGCLYHDGQFVGIPSDNLMTMFREGGTQISVGKGKKTFKAQTQSGIIVNEILWPIETEKGRIKWSSLTRFMSIKDFDEQCQQVLEYGFELFAKNARVGQSKHVRVRPKFRQWSASGTIMVTDEAITLDVLKRILLYAGTYCGLGDWRPSGNLKSPGSFGKFTSEVKVAK